jgi:flagellar motility protein MotE (MotC chaperone)
MKILTANWFVAIVGALAYLGTTFVCFSTAKFQPVNVVHEEPLPAITESWTFHNPELEKMIQELRHEKESLTTRSQQLKDLEARLGSERQELNVVTDTVMRLQKELDRTLLRIKQDEIPNLKKLAKTHAAMSAEGSANILKEQSDDEVLKVLFYLKPAESGPILEALARLSKFDAQRAALLTERLRRTSEVAAEEKK